MRLALSIWSNYLDSILIVSGHFQDIFWIICENKKNFGFLKNFWPQIQHSRFNAWKFCLVHYVKSVKKYPKSILKVSWHDLDTIQLIWPDVQCHCQSQIKMAPPCKDCRKCNLDLYCTNSVGYQKISHLITCSLVVFYPFWARRIFYTPRPEGGWNFTPP